MTHARYALVLLAAVVAGCMNESPVAVDQDPSAVPPAPKMVPFQAHEENTIIVTAPPPLLGAEFPGVIEGDHIGSGTIFSTSVVDFSDFPFIQTGEGVITAANGDEIYWEFAGTAMPGPGPGDIIFSGDYTFDGGTGRFENVTGHGTYAGTANEIEAVGQFDLDGVISR